MKIARSAGLLRTRWIALVAALTMLPAVAFDLQGHRGARGLAPENTMAGFERALAIGVTTIETDVVISKDGVPVIAHDPYVNPDLARRADGAYVTDRGILIRSLSLEQIKERYDIGRLNGGGDYARQWPEQQAADGQRYPTLQELVQLMKASGKPVRLNLETKLSPDRPEATPAPEEFARLVVEVLRREQFVDRTTLQSFDWRTLVEARKLVPGLATSCLTQMTPNFDNVKGTFGRPSAWTAGFNFARYDSVPRLVHAAGCTSWAMFFRNLTPEALAEAHALGLLVLPWTVNDPADMARLVDMRVDGIITDYPDRLRKVLAEKKVLLPENGVRP